VINVFYLKLRLKIAIAGFHSADTFDVRSPCLGFWFFKLLTFVAKNFARNSLLSLFTLLRYNLNNCKFADEKARWRNIINSLKSSVNHGAPLVWNLTFHYNKGEEKLKRWWRKVEKIHMRACLFKGNVSVGSYIKRHSRLTFAKAPARDQNWRNP
jgi:hypothetical protein